MNISESKNGTTLTLQLEGSLNTITASSLEAVITGAIDTITELEMDFSRVVYVSSAGLRVILGAQKQMSKKGGMIIRNVNEVVMDVFEVTGFTNILTIE